MIYKVETGEDKEDTESKTSKSKKKKSKKKKKQHGVIFHKRADIQTMASMDLNCEILSTSSF